MCFYTVRLLFKNKNYEKITYHFCSRFYLLYFWMHYLYLGEMKKQLYSVEDRIAHAEDNRLEWKLCIKYLVIICALAYLLVGCNIGLKGTSCPSHNPKWYAGKQKYYKH